MTAVRPYVTAERYVLNQKVVTEPIYWNGRRIKEVRPCRCRIRSKRRKYTVTFVDKTATIVDRGERLYFDAC